MEILKCPECHAPLLGVENCREYFDEMLAWDFTDKSVFTQVHHLTVLCYYLQHPSHYSAEGLTKAITIFKNAVENDVTDKQLYQEESNTFSSSKRTWRVNGTAENHGAYVPSITWTLNASDVVKDGIVKYPVHVKSWSQGIYHDLKNAGNIV